MVRLCHESRIARAFGITFALMYERIRWHQELNGGEPWAYQLTQLAEDLSISKMTMLRVVEKLESLEVNGKPVLIRKRGKYQVLWQITASEEEMIELAEKSQPDTSKEIKKSQDDTSTAKKSQNVTSQEANKSQSDTSDEFKKSQDDTSEVSKCYFLNESLNKNARKTELREFKEEEEEISTNVDTKKKKQKRYKRKVAQPAPSQLNLASVESICEEAIRRTKLPADHDEHQASNSIPIESFDWLDRDIWRDYHAKRNNLKSNWTYNAAKLTLIELSKAKEQTFKQQPPLTADEIHDYLNYFNSRATGQAPKVSFMFQHCRGNQFFQHSQPKSKPSLDDTLAARGESHPIKDVTPILKQISQ